MARGRWEPLGTLMALVANVMGGRRRPRDYDPFFDEREKSRMRVVDDPFAD
jgi:hypothetical protein